MRQWTFYFKIKKEITVEFKDLKEQYRRNQREIDEAIHRVLLKTNFISGNQVYELEERLASYVGVKHCISCANGTDALQLALMAWDIGTGDAVFVPDFTFFSTAEVVALLGATPVFVDVEEDTFNMSPSSLHEAIAAVEKEGILQARAVIAVDLFGQPANYNKIKPIVEAHHLKLLEDGAQGFGGAIREKRACSFGDISTTSFFPAKPLGCYGDGGAIFTDNDEWANLLRSYRVHGKGSDKYDNVRIGMNSRLDTLQAAVLDVKLNIFDNYELDAVNQVAKEYTKRFKEFERSVKTPMVLEGYLSSWAQYSILCKDYEERDTIQKNLKENNIPSMIYYSKPLHMQEAFQNLQNTYAVGLETTISICQRVLSLPFHPYLQLCEIEKIANIVNKAVK